MIDRIKEIVGMHNVLVNVSMSRYTTFHVGGNAACLVNVCNEKILMDLLRLLKEQGIPYYLLGNGSNLLISDQGYDGVMIRLDGEFREITMAVKAADAATAAKAVKAADAATAATAATAAKAAMTADVAGADTVTVYAGAAAPLTQTAQKAMENSLSGLEFAYGIPGTIGGAIVMNAGAYGGEMRQVVESVRLLDTDEGNIKIINLQRDEMEFGYRTSILKRKPYIVLSAELKLCRGSKQDILAKMNANMAARKEKQPLEYPSAGSTFKRPEGYFAGKLIQDAGLKGYRVGSAQVSEKHCGFVVNTGGATADDISQLICDVQNKVKEASGVMLEPEVIFLGKFDKL